MQAIGIRREDKSRWERRTPLVPAHAKKLVDDFGLSICVQSSGQRAFGDQEFERAGAAVGESVDHCDIILGVKEIPPEKLLHNKTYLFFSHTIKGQSHNMPMLKKLLDLRCTLIDYECIKNKKGQRLVFFGRHAGLAGMIDSLSLLGKQLLRRGHATPFAELKYAHEYYDVGESKKAIAKAGDTLRATGIPEVLNPLIIGITGYGRVSGGAQEILDLLPVKEIEPAKIESVFKAKQPGLYKVVFHEQHMFEPVEAGSPFDLQGYFDKPHRYRARFEQYLPCLGIVVNAIYWEPKYPRLITRQFLREHQAELRQSLWHICDITCDINGSVECTVKATEPDNPVFVYDPITERINDGLDGDGITVLAVDNLPAEIPRDASEAFSEALWRFIPELARANFDLPFSKLELSPEIKNAIIAYNGELAPQFKYLERHL